MCITVHPIITPQGKTYEVHICVKERVYGVFLFNKNVFCI
jgi:hypothetical protein